MRVVQEILYASKPTKTVSPYSLAIAFGLLDECAEKNAHVFFFFKLDGQSRKKERAEAGVADEEDKSSAITL